MITSAIRLQDYKTMTLNFCEYFEVKKLRMSSCRHVHFFAHSWHGFLLSGWKARKWPSELRRKVAINVEMFSNFYHQYCVKSINIINFSTEAPQLQWTVQFKPGANGIAKDCCTSGGWRWTQGGHFFHETALEGYKDTTERVLFFFIFLQLLLELESSHGWL